MESFCSRLSIYLFVNFDVLYHFLINIVGINVPTTLFQAECYLAQNVLKRSIHPPEIFELPVPIAGDFYNSTFSISHQPLAIHYE